MLRIGIDLGTTNTVVSYINANGEWEKLRFTNGRREDPCLLPSVVAIKNQLPVIGQEAVDYSIIKPLDCCTNRKREMGQRSVSWLIGTEYISPEKLSEYILREVYTELNRKFPGETFNAFVTVPAGFTNNARLATKKCLISVGFEMDDNCLSDEPIAAAIAYSSALSDDEYVLVVDIGGGTFDLCLLKSNIVGSTTSPNRLIPISVGSDLNNGLFLGGDAIDDVIYRYMVREFNDQFGTNVPKDIKDPNTASDDEIRAGAIMKSLILDIKIAIYSGSEARCYRASILPGKDLDFTLSQEKYCELMAQPFVEEERDSLSVIGGFKYCIDNLFRGIDREVRQKVKKVLVVGGMAHEICLNRLLNAQFANVIVAPEDQSLYFVSKGAAICNSNMRPKIDNIAYTSIGLVLHNGAEVSNIITEGSLIESGMVFERRFKVEDKAATAVKVKLVEYRGTYKKSDYDNGKYAVILDENIQLTENVLSLINPFGLKFRAVVQLICRFTDDKILLIGVKHKDKTHWLDINLGR